MTGIAMRRLRILVADDHEAVREGLKAILTAQDDMDVVGEAADGNTAVAQAVALSPDVVILDVSMPALNGLKATEQIRSQCPAAVVLALTRHSSDGYLHQLLRAGAAGYVLKQSRSATLLHAIRAVARFSRFRYDSFMTVSVSQSQVVRSAWISSWTPRRSST